MVPVVFWPENTKREEGGRQGERDVQNFNEEKSVLFLERTIWLLNRPLGHDQRGQRGRTDGKGHVPSYFRDSRAILDSNGNRPMIKEKEVVNFYDSGQSLWEKEEGMEKGGEQVVVVGGGRRYPKQNGRKTG